MANDTDSHKIMSSKTVEIKVLSVFDKMLVNMWQGHLQEDRSESWDNIPIYRTYHNDCGQADRKECQNSHFSAASVYARAIRSDVTTAEYSH